MFSRSSMFQSSFKSLIVQLSFRQSFLSLLVLPLFFAVSATAQEGEQMHNLQKNIDGQSEIEALSKTGGNPLAIKSYIQKSRMETSGTAPLNLAQSSANQPQNSSFAAAGLDNNFNAKVEDGVLWVFATAIQSDGKYLIGGTFQTVNDLPKRFLARLNADGNLDGSFNAGNSGPNGYLEDIELLPDGKILISGGFTSYNGISRINILTLTAVWTKRLIRLEEPMVL
jgi:hypothetical protein